MENSFVLAFTAGLVAIISPCILPMLPIVTASSLRSGLKGLVSLSLGLGVAFALIGSLVTYVLLQLNINTEVFRYVSASLLIIFAIFMLVPALSELMSQFISKAQVRLQSFRRMRADSKPIASSTNSSVFSEFFIGFGLGSVWLPCVGPTLGSAIALASFGEQLIYAFSILLIYGLGAGVSLSLVGLFSTSFFNRLKENANAVRQTLAISLLAVGLMVLTGFDKTLETLALRYLPSWLYSL